MPKKKIKEEIRKPDPLVMTVEYVLSFLRANFKMCVIAMTVMCVAALAAYGYTFYQGKKDEKAQSQLFQGIKSFEQYSMTGKKEDLDKAAETFQKVILMRQGKISKVAKLYMGTVDATRGKTEEARKVLTELSKETPQIIAMLSEKTLKSLDKP